MRVDAGYGQNGEQALFAYMDQPGQFNVPGPLQGAFAEEIISAARSLGYRNEFQLRLHNIFSSPVQINPPGVGRSWPVTLQLSVASVNGPVPGNNTSVKLHIININ